MSEYYLMAQLPSLDAVGDNMPIPITEERFLELCQRFLSKKAKNEVENLSLTPSVHPLPSSSRLINAWNEGERKLRLVLAKIRADKMNKSYDVDISDIPTATVNVAGEAVEIDNPLEAENFLNRYRLEFLESLRPADGFSTEAVFYYGLKLKLILRIRQFSVDAGRSAYKNIYTSIINGDGLEAIQ